MQSALMHALTARHPALAHAFAAAFAAYLHDGSSGTTHRKGLARLVQHNAFEQSAVHNWSHAF